MASNRPVVPQPPRVGVAKQKNGPAEARNRRVLRDIGNLVTVPAAEGKPNDTRITRPITRSFCAQLIANAQAAAEKNNKKPLADVVNGVVPKKDGGEVKAAVQKKEVINNKPTPKKVIVVSPVKEVKAKDNPISAKKSTARSSKKTLTSILTARSKDACGLAKKPNHPVIDIDAADIDNELAAVEYVEDIYKFYKMTEDEGRVCDYMDLQTEINAKMRAILIDWLIEVHRKFELMPESLYLTVNVVDRFLSTRNVPRRELQLVGISSMLIACKYEEIWAPEVGDLIAISDNAYIREQVLRMEKAVLGELEWYLTVPTPYVFLVRYIKASVPSDKEMENMVFFLAELGLMHYPTVIMYCPSMIAASAVYAARCTLNKIPLWTETLKHCTTYSEHQLMNCAKFLVSLHSAAAESKLRAVYKKFSYPERGAVALLPAASSLSPGSV